MLISKSPANKWGAAAGIVAGLGVCIYYMVTTYPWLREVFGITKPVAEVPCGSRCSRSRRDLGMPVGFITMIVVSLLTPKPEQEVQPFVESVRYPQLAGAIDTRGT
ncbi:MAG: hypothetical protein RML56_07120 [Burkholderiales bacterium]|nr:hypothetical protein [Burkholderiales bacterium]